MLWIYSEHLIFHEASMCFGCFVTREICVMDVQHMVRMNGANNDICL